LECGKKGVTTEMINKRYIGNRVAFVRSPEVENILRDVPNKTEPTIKDIYVMLSVLVLALTEPANDVKDSADIAMKEVIRDASEKTQINLGK
jgi:hypothetical protein